MFCSYVLICLIMTPPAWAAPLSRQTVTDPSGTAQKRRRIWSEVKYDYR